MPGTDPGIDLRANLTALPPSFDPSPVSAAQLTSTSVIVIKPILAPAARPTAKQFMRSIGVCHDY